MPQLDHKPCRVGIFGRSGSGKTTFGCRYITAHPARLRFLYDPEHEFTQRFKLRPARDPDQLDAALASGWVVYQPDGMFADDEAGLEFFCDWALRVCSVTPGHKLLVVDEFQEYVSPNYVPPHLKRIIQRGRRYGCDLLAIGQTPSECGPKLRTQLTTLVTFQFSEPNHVEWLGRYGFNPDQVRALGPYEWIQRDSWGEEKTNAGGSLRILAKAGSDKKEAFGVGVEPQTENRTKKPPHAKPEILPDDRRRGRSGQRDLGPRPHEGRNVTRRRTPPTKET